MTRCELFVRRRTTLNSWIVLAFGSNVDTPACCGSVLMAFELNALNGERKGRDILETPRKCPLLFSTHDVSYLWRSRWAEAPASLIFALLVMYYNCITTFGLKKPLSTDQKWKWNVFIFNVRREQVNFFLVFVILLLL